MRNDNASISSKINFSPTNVHRIRIFLGLYSKNIFQFAIFNKLLKKHKWKNIGKNIKSKIEPESFACYFFRRLKSLLKILNWYLHLIYGSKKTRAPCTFINFREKLISPRCIESDQLFLFLSLFLLSRIYLISRKIQIYSFTYRAKLLISKINSYLLLNVLIIIYKKEIISICYPNFYVFMTYLNACNIFYV